ncbi:LysM peptidoglycan-binding domain-containing protein [Kitasatospora sp. NPDC096147]|uniref:LysM peptidoglycan-binding domain-containing protein n=1 Tax=Kitasatospora sp. NPDC096147 TaxID=3364093 RepID=UPI00380DA048
MAQANDMIAMAASQLGYREGGSPGNYNNKQKYSGEVPGLEWSNYQPWCATFVSWVAMKAGLADRLPRTASCATGVNWFENKGRFSAYPAVGAQVFFGPGGGTHTGLVTGYDGDFIFTIEGNTNDEGSPEGYEVCRRKRARRDGYVHGYGLPAYAEGVTTADPMLKGKSGFVYAATASGPAGNSTSTRTIVVRAGQTLGAIAAAAGVTLATVLSLNPGIKNPDVIQPGQPITVPANPQPGGGNGSSGSGSSGGSSGGGTPPVPESQPEPPKPTNPSAGRVPAYAGRPFSYSPGQQPTYSPQVRQWQAQMRARGWDITVDGLYGPKSASVARRFQAQKGLRPVDAVVGPITWRAAWTAPVT